MHISFLLAISALTMARLSFGEPPSSKDLEKRLGPKEAFELSKLEFNISDFDKDGFVSRAEIEARAVYVMNSLDSDKDGFLSQEEFRRLPLPLVSKLGPSESLPLRRQAGEELFSVLDRNGDGKLDKAELKAAFAASFEAMDKDGDGRVSLSEFLVFRVERKESKAASKLP